MSEVIMNDWVRHIDWAAKSHVNQAALQSAENDFVEFSDEDRMACREQYLKDLKTLYWADKIATMPNIVFLHDQAHGDIEAYVMELKHCPSSLRSFTDTGETPNPYNHDLETAAAEADYLYIIGDNIDSPDAKRAMNALRPDVKARFINANIALNDTLNDHQVLNFRPNEGLL